MSEKHVLREIQVRQLLRISTGSFQGCTRRFNVISRTHPIS